MKEITIKVPDNYELKQDGNTYTIVEKEKKLTYEDIIKELYPHSREKVMAGYFSSEKHLQKLLAINKLMNVAKYLNGDWQPDWKNRDEDKIFIYIDNLDKNIKFGRSDIYKSLEIYFKSEKLAKQAIEILGEETIKLALCTDY